jgi:phosphoglycolate phosphatase-like HAD superfamily hydrolase
MSAGPWRLDDLAVFGPRTAADMRPTLLRVLTELYLQKPTHTADEELHYTELALRLLDAVDAGSRAIVAERLARYPSAPLRVIERLAADLPQVAVHVQALALRRELPSPLGPVTGRGKLTAQAPFAREVAAALNELFFTSDADERRLILLNLELLAPFPLARVKLTPTTGLGERLEAAILSRKRETFAQSLAQALQISGVQARRVIDDDFGEPIVTAAKALNISRGVLYRILLFLNMRTGHSVARIQALARLHHELPIRAAEQMVAIWQSLPEMTRPAERHYQLLWDDHGARKREARLTANHAASTPWPAERRGAP